MPARAPSARPARADRLHNHEQIQLAAAALLAREPGASVQAIADEAGLTRLTVYRHYPSRAVLEEALGASIDARAAAVLDDLPGWDGGPTVLRVLIRGLADLVRRYPVIAARHRVETGAQQSDVDARLSEVLRQGQRAGVLTPDLDAEVLNATLYAVLTAHARLRPDASVTELADGVTDLLLQGLVVRRPPEGSSPAPRSSAAV